MLLHKKPEFERIVIYHNDNSTLEYQDIDAEYVDEIPDIQFFNDDEESNVNTRRTLFIIEDIDYKSLPKQQKSLLDRLFGVFSTHHNISVWVTGQDPFMIPANPRRMANIIILWKNHDLNSLAILSSRFNIKTSDLRYIFNNICNKEHDSLIIDTTTP